MKGPGMWGDAAHAGARGSRLGDGSDAYPPWTLCSSSSLMTQGSCAPAQPSPALHPLGAEQTSCPQGGRQPPDPCVAELARPQAPAGLSQG